MIFAVAKLRCAICSHEWLKKLQFANFHAIEAHNFTLQQCPECTARVSMLLPYAGEDSFNRLCDGETFENPVDENDSADDWKRG